jgi:hypothetical protein
VNLCGDFLDGPMNASCDRLQGHGLPHRSVRSFVSVHKGPQIVTVEWGDTELASVNFDSGPGELKEVPNVG